MSFLISKEQRDLVIHPKDVEITGYCLKFCVVDQGLTADFTFPVPRYSSQIWPLMHRKILDYLHSTYKRVGLPKHFIKYSKFKLDGWLMLRLGEEGYVIIDSHGPFKSRLSGSLWQKKDCFEEDKFFLPFGLFFDKDVTLMIEILCLYFNYLNKLTCRIFDEYLTKI